MERSPEIVCSFFAVSMKERVNSLAVEEGRLSSVLVTHDLLEFPPSNRWAKQNERID